MNYAFALSKDFPCLKTWSTNRGSSVAIVTRLRSGRPSNRGLIHDRRKRFFSFPNYLHRLRSPPNFLGAVSTGV